jgi:hypothetical protein
MHVGEIDQQPGDHAGGQAEPELETRERPHRRWRELRFDDHAACGPLIGASPRGRYARSAP